MKDENKMIYSSLIPHPSSLIPSDIMSPEHWQKVEAIVLSALEVAPERRGEFLDEKCAGDLGLREEVLSLLDCDDDAENFINAPAVAFAAELFPQENKQDSIIGKQIGHYKIAKEIGRGGMGAVYLAVRADEQYKKEVAIKLLRSGLETEDLHRHFRYERQILASLDHPNIARLLDGGTTEDGLPYFVMEYVEGVPIDKYCFEKKLSTNEKLKLFRAVCDAVSFAHRNLIIHRDIKPSNILVTSDGVPKLLDFGIAKLIDPEHLQESKHTITTLRAMTPEYASPEQVRGETVSTASDVYSLGVVFYELLCGHRPYFFNVRKPEEIIRAVCETEPPKPSDAGTRRNRDTEKVNTSTNLSASPRLRISASQLKGDLDNIALKALRKEPARRYASVEQFSEDIRRHLEGLPVLARADTFGYRASKFISRHRVGVAAAALIVLSIVVGVIATITQARRAEAQRARAEKRFNDVRKLANSILSEINPAIEKVPGTTHAREILVKTSLEYLDSLAQESSNDTELQKELADAYEKVGDVQGYPGKPNLGDLRGALESYQKARVIREALLAAGINDVKNRDALATNYEHIGLALWWASDIKATVENYNKAFAIRDALSKENPQDAEQQHKLADLQMAFGDVSTWNGNTDEALSYYKKAQAILNTLLVSQPENNEYKTSLARCYTRIGDAMGWANDLKGGEKEIEKAIAILEPLVNSNPNDMSFKSVLLTTYMRAGENLADTDTARALEVFRKALVLGEEMVKADPINSKARYDLGLNYARIGEIFQLRKDYAASMSYLKKAIDNQEALTAIDPKNTAYKTSLANCYNTFGKSQMLNGNLSGAMESQQRAFRLRESLAANPKDISAQRDLAISWYEIGTLQMKMNKWREAKESLQTGLDILLLLQSQHALREYDRKEVESLKENLKKCDAVLAKNANQ